VCIEANELSEGLTAGEAKITRGADSRGPLQQKKQTRVPEVDRCTRGKSNPKKSNAIIHQIREDRGQSISLSDYSRPETTAGNDEARI
jgi:hypothetical protein